MGCTSSQPHASAPVRKQVVRNSSRKVHPEAPEAAQCVRKSGSSNTSMVSTGSTKSTRSSLTSVGNLNKMSVVSTGSTRSTPSFLCDAGTRAMRRRSATQWCRDRSGSTLQFLDRSCSMAPVKLVVFDFDGTLTLTTLAPKPGNTPQCLTKCVRVSFSSPWVKERLQKLENMLRTLICSKSACKLAVLTRNSGGVHGVLQLLHRAGLSKYFSAVWCLPTLNKSAFQEDGQWHLFTPGVAELPDETPDVLQDIVDRASHWLPSIDFQLQLSMDNILLVDNDSDNFQSTVTGIEVTRGCKVAVHCGKLLYGIHAANLGGIGARFGQDFEALERFVCSLGLHTTA